jgi:HlyD family secretion protein
MKHYLKNTIVPLIKRPIVYIPLALIVAALGFWQYSSRSGAAGEQIVTVEAATFVQEVSVTGKVVAAKDVTLGFDSSGRVSGVQVAVGDKVKAGKYLVGLSNGDVYANVLQRQAQVDVEIAKLSEIQRGSRAEDIAIAETDVSGAQSTYNQSIQSLVDGIKDSYAKVDDAVRSKVDQLYTNPRTVRPEIMPFDNYNLRESLNQQRLVIGEILTSWSSDVNTLSVSTYSESNLSVARNNLDKARNFFNDLTSAVSALQANSGMTQATIDKYRSDISSGRITISTAISNLSSGEQLMKTNATALQRAQNQLALKRAGSTSEQISTQQAQVKSAEAQLRNAQALYAKTVITAPFDGIITKVDAKQGETISPSTAVISMISDSAYEIESYISESDISKVQVGQMARITLDAYGKDIVFPAKLIEVDPAETVLDGVSTYKTKLAFVTADDRVRSGMTANITIQTSEKPASVIIPQEALFLEGGEKMVTVDEAGKRVNKKVETGGINADGEIEVISGLNVGDRLVIKAK